MITIELLFHFLGRGSNQREQNQENRVGLRQIGIHLSVEVCECWSIVLMEEHSSCQLSTPNLLDFVP